MNLSKKSIYQHIGEAHYLYNQIRWTITQIGWWYYKEEKPKYLGEKWGIDNFNDFYEFVLTIKELNGKEITSYELEESYFYIESLPIVKQ